jgi:hypothetical protein
MHLMLPYSFEQQHAPGSWWMEAIFKVGLNQSVAMHVL